jgi:hypothetical protein
MAKCGNIRGHRHGQRQRGLKKRLRLLEQSLDWQNVENNRGQTGIQRQRGLKKRLRLLEQSLNGKICQKQSLNDKIWQILEARSGQRQR